MASLRNFLPTSIHLFALFCILLLPIPLNLFPTYSLLTDWIFKRVLLQIARVIYPDSPTLSGISSDSLLLYLLIAVFLVLSLLLSCGLLFSSKWEKLREKVFAGIRLFSAYFVATQLLKYGFAKIFKTQFYLPEPNILFTPFGELSQDILFWSVMGTSRLYCILSGLAEVIAGALILWQRTRTIGLLLSAILFANVVAINISFDISVKVFSILLFFLSLLSLSPQIQSLYDFFIRQKFISLKLENFIFPLIPPVVVSMIRVLILLLLFSEILYPYLKYSNFNDDNAPRPFLHGAYEVSEIYSSSGKQLPKSSWPIKRIFIHRDGYLIVQNQQDQMTDYVLSIDPLKRIFALTDDSGKKFICPFEVNSPDSSLIIELPFTHLNYTLHLKSIPWKSLPAIQPAFHWTIESIQ